MEEAQESVQVAGDGSAGPHAAGRLAVVDRTAAPASPGDDVVVFGLGNAQVAEEERLPVFRVSDPEVDPGALVDVVAPAEAEAHDLFPVEASGRGFRPERIDVRFVDGLGDLGEIELQNALELVEDVHLHLEEAREVAVGEIEDEVPAPGGIGPVPVRGPVALGAVADVREHPGHVLEERRAVGQGHVVLAFEREGLGPVHLGDLAGCPEGIDQPPAGNAVGQAALRRGRTRTVDDVDVGALGGTGFGGVSRRLDDDLVDEVGVDRGQGPRVDGVGHDDPVLDQDVGRDRGPLEGGPQSGLVVLEHESGNEAQDGREIAGQGQPGDEVLVQDDRHPRGIPVEERAGPAGHGLLFDVGGLHPEIEGDGHPRGKDEAVDRDGLEPGHLGDGLVAAGDQSGDGVAARFGGDVVRDPERRRRGHVEVGPRERRALVVDDPAPEGALGARRGGG